MLRAASALLLLLAPALAFAGKCETFCSPAIVDRCKKACNEECAGQPCGDCYASCDSDAQTCVPRCEAMIRNKGNLPQAQREIEAIFKRAAAKTQTKADAREETEKAHEAH